MLKLFKKFKEKDLIILLICVILIAFQVWLDLRLPEYMSKITVLIKTEGSHMS